MAALKGNCVIAQSGGPTAVINNSYCGVIQEAVKHADIKGIYGAHNGILGVLNEELFDLRKEKREAIEALRRTPSAASGTCRYKLKSLEADRADYDRILDVFKAHDIRYFFYVGGNDSMDTADKLGKLAADTGYELRIMGIPKTIDNDLACTDHCPGYGSVAKYLATTVMEAGRDTEAIYTADTCTVLETMGRNAGWIGAAAGLAHRTEQDAPHLVYVSEVPFDADQFVEDVKRVISKLGRCFVVASEGLADKDGNYVTAQAGQFSVDAFGHRQLGGVAEILKEIVETRVKVKCRYNKPGTSQRNAMHFASKTDADEAYMVGQAAVREAVAGKTGLMVTLVRGKGERYKCSTGLAKLVDIANGEKKLPRDFMNKAGNHITEKMRRYALPLIKGEVSIKVGKDGLPVYARLEKHFAKKKLGPWAGAKK